MKFLLQCGSKVGSVPVLLSSRLFVSQFNHFNPSQPPSQPQPQKSQQTSLDSPRAADLLSLMFSILQFRKRYIASLTNIFSNSDKYIVKLNPSQNQPCFSWQGQSPQICTVSHGRTFEHQIFFKLHIRHFPIQISTMDAQR